MSVTAVTRATVLRPVYRSMDLVNAPVMKLAHRWGLPTGDIDDSDLWIPSHAALMLTVDLHRLIGPEAFGIWMERASDLTALGPLGEILHRTRTLYAALTRFCHYYPQFRTHARLSMVRKGDDLWLRRHALPGPVANNPIMEFFGLNEMIMVVRQAAGASWRPRRVILRCHDDALLEAMPHMAGGSAVFGTEFAAIPIPIRFLSRLMTHGHRNGGMLATDDAPDWSSPPERFADILLEIISARFPDGYPAIETMAECIGVTPRTVQRKLAVDRLTYRELIDYHRFKTAKRMILEDRVRIIDIAAELDYEHASSFARAFRRWAGVSPRDYRSQQLMTY